MRSPEFKVCYPFESCMRRLMRCNGVGRRVSEPVLDEKDCEQEFLVGGGSSE